MAQRPHHQPGLKLPRPPSHKTRNQAAARDLERLPQEIRIDCYRLNLGPFKAGVEDGMRRLREALGTVLRRKVGSSKRAPQCHSHCADIARHHAWLSGTTLFDRWP